MGGTERRDRRRRSRSDRHRLDPTPRMESTPREPIDRLTRLGLELGPAERSRHRLQLREAPAAPSFPIAQRSVRRRLEMETPRCEPWMKRSRPEPSRLGNHEQRLPSDHELGRTALFERIEPNRNRVLASRHSPHELLGWKPRVAPIVEEPDPRRIGRVRGVVGVAASIEPLLGQNPRVWMTTPPLVPRRPSRRERREPPTSERSLDRPPIDLAP